MYRQSWRLAAAMAFIAAAACRPEFELKNLTSNDALYGASMAEYQRGHWDNAVTGFEKLTTDLAARDTLLPRSYWYLAQAHEHLGEHLLAAQSFGRIVESFPEDTLADDAGLEAARSYRKLWRKPQLDPTYGQTALAQYNMLIGLYPTSPLIPTAQKEIDGLEDWFALKDYDAGMYYFRRAGRSHDFDPGIIYFKDVLAKYPNTPTARLAGIRMIEAFKQIHYKEDASELCGQMLQRYADDKETVLACQGVTPTAPAPPDSTPPPAKPPTR